MLLLNPVLMLVDSLKGQKGSRGLGGQQRSQVPGGPLHLPPTYCVALDKVLCPESQMFSSVRQAEAMVYYASEK